MKSYTGIVLGAALFASWSCSNTSKDDESSNPGDTGTPDSASDAPTDDGIDDGTKGGGDSDTILSTEKDVLDDTSSEVEPDSYSDSRSRV